MTRSLQSAYAAARRRVGFDVLIVVAAIEVATPSTMRWAAPACRPGWRCRRSTERRQSRLRAPL